MRWETSTTVVYTVVWRNSAWFDDQCRIQRCDWLRNASCCNVPSNNFQAVGFFKPITALHSALIIKPRNFAKPQCKLQWLMTSTKATLHCSLQFLDVLRKRKHCSTYSKRATSRTLCPSRCDIRCFKYQTSNESLGFRSHHLAIE